VHMHMLEICAWIVHLQSEPRKWGMTRASNLQQSKKYSPFARCIATHNNHDLAIVRQHCRMTIVAMVFLQYCLSSLTVTCTTTFNATTFGILVSPFYSRKFLFCLVDSQAKILKLRVVDNTTIYFL
jgi:hypothetical protein